MHTQRGSLQLLCNGKTRIGVGTPEHGPVMHGALSLGSHGVGLTNKVGSISQRSVGGVGAHSVYAAQKIALIAGPEVRAPPHMRQKKSSRVVHVDVAHAAALRGEK